VPDLMENPPAVQKIEPEVLPMQPSENASSTVSPISEDAPDGRTGRYRAHFVPPSDQPERSVFA